MAYSNIRIDFFSMPSEGTDIKINESSLGINLNEIFKNFRSAPSEVKIPDSFQGRYGLTISYSTSTNNIGVTYRPIGEPSYVQLPLESLEIMDNADGTYTYIVYSDVSPMLYDIATGDLILWNEGQFVEFGGGAGTYAGSVSENYKAAIDLDFNSSNIFHH